jgi:hypothetical protein
VSPFTATTYFSVGYAASKAYAYTLIEKNF